MMVCQTAGKRRMVWIRCPQSASRKLRVPRQRRCDQPARAPGRNGPARQWLGSPASLERGDRRTLRLSWNSAAHLTIACSPGTPASTGSRMWQGGVVSGPCFDEPELRSGLENPFNQFPNVLACDWSPSGSPSITSSKPPKDANERECELRAWRQIGLETNRQASTLADVRNCRGACGPKVAVWRKLARINRRTMKAIRWRRRVNQRCCVCRTCRS